MSSSLIAEQVLRKTVREIIIQEGLLDDLISGIKTGVGKTYDVVSDMIKDKNPEEEESSNSDKVFSAPVQAGSAIQSMISGITDARPRSNRDNDRLAFAADVVRDPESFGFNTGGSGGRWSLTPFERWCPPGSAKCKKMRPHHGVDINRENNKDGAPIVSPLDGVVVSTGRDGTCGYKLRIQHGDKGFTRYCHLKGPPIVNEGESVVAGQRIGYVGSTGRSSGPHLHFETYSTGGSNINPLEWLSSNALYFPISMG